MTELGRRTFVVTTLASGFALAVTPVSAQTITTDGAGLLAGEIKIGAIPAYRAQPEAGAKFPLIVVVPEICSASTAARTRASRWRTSR